LCYSIGFGLPAHAADLLTQIPAEAWTPPYDAHDVIREGAWARWPVTGKHWAVRSKPQVSDLRQGGGAQRSGLDSF
jgi:hypothetical protein